MVDENCDKQERSSLVMPLVLFDRIVTLFKARSSICREALQAYTL